MINIFLDLEETVIDSWESCIFLNHKIDRIRKIIKHFSIKFNNEEATNENTNLILFSAAVVNDEDLNIFKKDIQFILESKLGINFKSEFIFSNKNCFDLIKGKGIIPLKNDTIHDIFQFNIKEEVFNLLVKEKEVNILFDDTISNKMIEESSLFSDDIKQKTIKILIDMDI